MRPTCCPRPRARSSPSARPLRDRAQCRASPRRRAPANGQHGDRRCPRPEPATRPDLPEAELVERLLADHEHARSSADARPALERGPGQRELDGSGALAAEARHGVDGHGRDSGAGEGEPDVARREADAEREAIAATTASAAPALTPRMPGSASGLRATPCIAAPARPRASPDEQAGRRVRGTRDCTTSVVAVGGVEVQPRVEQGRPADGPRADGQREQAAEHEHHPTAAARTAGRTRRRPASSAGRAAGAAGRTPDRSPAAVSAIRPGRPRRRAGAGSGRAPRAGSAGWPPRWPGSAVSSGSATRAPRFTAGIWPSSGSFSIGSTVVASGTHVTKTSDSSSSARSADHWRKNCRPWCSGSTTGACPIPICVRKRGRLS